MISAPVLALLVVLAGSQTSSTNPACSLLTTHEAASIIGAGGTPISVSVAPTGASCLVQNGDKVITVLEATLASADAATGLWTAKKHIVGGDDLAGWPTKGNTFIEVRVTDSAPAKTDMASKLQTVMKAVAARMP